VSAAWSRSRRPASRRPPEDAAALLPRTELLHKKEFAAALQHNRSSQPSCESSAAKARGALDPSAKKGATAGSPPAPRARPMARGEA